MTTTTTAGRHAALSPLDAAHARWAQRLLGRHARAHPRRDRPAHLGSLSDPAVSPGLRNFRIAAGLEARHARGPPFIDGDFYKWLEAADRVARDATRSRARRADRRRSPRSIASVQRDDGYLHTPTLHRRAQPRARRSPSPTASTSRRTTSGTSSPPASATTGHRQHDAARCRAQGAAGSSRTSRRTSRSSSPAARSARRTTWRVVDLYRATGDERYLRLAEAFVAVRDDFETAATTTRTASRSASRRSSPATPCGPTTSTPGSPTSSPRRATRSCSSVLESLWHDVVDTKLYITGGCGALYDGASPDGYPWQGEISRVHQAYGRAYQLPHTTAHDESCANIGMILWSERMLALTGDAAYADVIEQHRLQQPARGHQPRRAPRTSTRTRCARCATCPTRCGMPGDTGHATRCPSRPPSDERLRAAYLSCFCCPPNIARTLARFHERAASTSADGAVRPPVRRQRAPTSRSTTAGASRLRETSDYPWGERDRVHGHGCRGRRHPAAPAHPGVVDGCRRSPSTASRLRASRAGHVRRDRAALAGRRRRGARPCRCRVRMLRGHRLAEEVANQVAVTARPGRLRLESADLPDGVRLEQVALRRGAELTPVETELDGHRVVALEGEARRAARADDDGALRRRRRRRPRAASGPAHPLLRVGQPRTGRDVGVAPLVW